MSAIVLYWAIVLILLAEVRRELVGRSGKESRTGLVRVLYAAIAVSATGAVILTALRLRSGL